MIEEQDQNVDLNAEEDQPSGFDASNPGKVGEREKRSKERAIRRKDGLKQILENPNARVWLWDFVTSLRPFGTTFTSPDPIVIAYNAGRKDVSLELLAELTKPEYIAKFVQMMEEAN